MLLELEGIKENAGNKYCSVVFIMLYYNVF